MGTVSTVGSVETATCFWRQGAPWRDFYVETLGKRPARKWATQHSDSFVIHGHPDMTSTYQASAQVVTQLLSPLDPVSPESLF